MQSVNPSPDFDGRILIMDDDADLCMVSKGMLEFLGYTADTALSSEAAIELFRTRLEHGDPYAAVILDLTMNDGLNGEDVLQELKQLQPTVKAIVCSGHAHADNADKFQKMGFISILAKPYRSADVSRALREVVANPA